MQQLIEDLKSGADAPNPMSQPEAESVALVLECLTVLQDFATCAFARMVLEQTEETDPMPDWQRPMRAKDAAAAARLRRACRRRRPK